MAVTVWSIGHSTHALTEFVELLQAHAIRVVADIRTVPKSRRHPHFHAKSLAESLPRHGIAYSLLPSLGGWRKTLEGSPNDAWQNVSFRGYADYALTPDFREGLAELRRRAGTEPTAMMCSEALWWRCHRRIVADYLVAAGDTVLHIGSNAKSTPHRLTEFAVVSPEGRITYPADRES